MPLNDVGNDWVRNNSSTLGHLSGLPKSQILKTSTGTHYVLRSVKFYSIRYKINLLYLRAESGLEIVYRL